MQGKRAPFLVVCGSLLITFSCGGGCGGKNVTVTPPANSSLQVTKPGSGEVLVAGTKLAIEWVKNSSSTVDIDFLFTDGSSLAVGSSLPNSGKYLWQVPLTHSGKIEGATLEVHATGGAPASAAVNADVLFNESGSDPLSATGLTFGSFAALQWNSDDSLEEYYWIDPTLGTASVIGTVGDLATLPWPRPAAVDNSSKLLYVVGSDSSQVGKVYTLD